MQNIDDSWDVPDWPEPWEPEFEVPALKVLAQAIQERSDAVVCVPDFSVEGCAFVQFYLGETNIGRACVGRHATGNPFYSAYFGATGDEFHGFNLLAIARMATAYDTSIEDAPDLEP